LPTKATEFFSYLKEKLFPDIFVEGSRKARKTAVRVVVVPAEI
jgi:hypothetical protein